MRLTIDESGEGLGISLGNDRGGYIPLTRKAGTSTILKTFDVNAEFLLESIMRLKAQDE